MDQNVYMAKLAEQAERYDEMIDYVKSLAASTDQTVCDGGAMPTALRLPFLLSVERL